ncbi:MAG: hypothetical protein KC589_04635 [Nanoarchaeota archaeon]|nr:hypothetical protein [Nanoarchaeota archaeon]
MNNKTKIIITICILIFLAFITYYTKSSNTLTNKYFEYIPPSLDLKCQTNLDCNKEISYNTCRIYCVNNNKENLDTILNLKKTCDFTLWDPLDVDECICIENQCQFNTANPSQ